MPFWEQWMSQLAQAIGDTSHLLLSFSIGLAASIALIAAIYSILVEFTRKLCGDKELEYKRVFSSFAFVALPLAFAYHMAHNLNHLIRESVGSASVFSNPLGIGTLPLSMLEKHERSMHMWMSQDLVFAIQAGLIMFGFWIALQVIRHRGRSMVMNTGRFAGFRLLPMLVFAVGITGFHLWLLMQPMIMRM